LRKRVVLRLKDSDVLTLSYENFNWEEFKTKLRQLGLDIVRDEKIPCG